MRSIQRRYNNIARNNKDLSSFICFAKTITEQGFTEDTLISWSDKLVDKQDYRRAEKEALLVHLLKLNNDSPQ